MINTHMLLLEHYSRVHTWLLNEWVEVITAFNPFHARSVPTDFTTPIYYMYVVCNSFIGLKCCLILNMVSRSFQNVKPIFIRPHYTSHLVTASHCELSVRKYLHIAKSLLRFSGKVLHVKSHCINLCIIMDRKMNNTVTWKTVRKCYDLLLT